MITIAEFKKRSNSVIAEWQKDFVPLYRATNELKFIMFDRIFGTGSDGGKNSAMQELPTKSYSIKPLYISSKRLRNAPAKFKFGKPTVDSKGKTKKGKPIKSLFFPKGYYQLKNETSAKLPLQLTGKLLGGYFKSPIIRNQTRASITIDSSEKLKVKGLEKKYGKIFTPTKNEIQEFEKLLSKFITEDLNKKFQ
jgi:hypothetical protein